MFCAKALEDTVYNCLLFGFKALEEEVADDEGLELDLVEQMRGMGLEEEEKSSEPSVSKSSPLFEKTSLSTKVGR